MRNIKLVIEYDGTNFFGWQNQPNNLRTVQEELEKAIMKITGERTKTFGSGRTDRGVHARGQVANFLTRSSIPGMKFKLALNSVLPKDIVIQESIEVGSRFHARYSVKSKEYRYLIYNSETRSSLLRNYTYHVPQKLDFEYMQRASKRFIGTYDFASFMSSGSSVKDTIRTIYEAELKRNEQILEFSVKGNGFLYNMVRIMIGTLIEIGINKIDEDNISKAFQVKDRKLAGHTAPSQGLYLEKVNYN